MAKIFENFFSLPILVSLFPFGFPFLPLSYSFFSSSKLALFEFLTLQFYKMAFNSEHFLIQLNVISKIYMFVHFNSGFLAPTLFYTHTQTQTHIRFDSILFMGCGFHFSLCFFLLFFSIFLNKCPLFSSCRIPIMDDEI